MYKNSIATKVASNKSTGGTGNTWVASASSSSSSSNPAPTTKTSFLNRLVRSVTGKSLSSSASSSSLSSSSKSTDAIKKLGVVEARILENLSPVRSAADDSNWILLDRHGSQLPLEPLHNNSTTTLPNINRSESTTKSNEEMSLEEEIEPTIGLGHLPIELVCKIIGYLELNDRKNASLVCKRWRAAFLAGNFLSDVLVKANNNLFVSNRPPVVSELVSGGALLDGARTRHRASSAMASLLEPSTAGSAHFCSNLVNLEFEHESADVSLMLGNLRSLRKNWPSDFTGPLLPRLKLLKFTKTAISWRVLVDFLNECPNLETLHLVQCDSFFISGVPVQDDLRLARLRTLSLARNRYLTDSFLNFFVQPDALLESLDLSHCLLTKTQYKSIQNGQLALKSSHVVLTVENLIRLAAENMSGLRRLALNGVELFNHDVDSLLALVARVPELEHIELAALPGLKATTCMQALEKLPKLRSIDLGGSSQEFGNHKTLESLFVDAFKDLECIKLNAVKINDPEIFKLNVGKCTKLTHLDLSACFFLRSFGTLSRMNEFIAQLARNLTELVHLETLVLAYCDFMVNDEFVQVVAPRLARLKHLDLRNCGKITDKSVHAIARHLADLVYLDLSWCQNVSDYGLNSTIEYSRDRQLLNELNKDFGLFLKKYAEQPFLLIKQKVQIANETKKLADATNNNSDENTPASPPPAVVEEPVSLKDLKCLRTLKLESCINITDVGLYRGVDLCQLKELDVKLCPEVKGDFVYARFDRIGGSSSSESESASSSRRRSCLFNNLKTLNLNQCVNFDINCLRFIVENAPFLRELSVSALPSVDVEFVQYLTRTRKLLTHFDVSFCSNVTEASVDAYEHVLFNGFGSKEFVLDRRFISK